MSQDFIERLEKEQEELDERIEKLTAFTKTKTFSDLSEEHRDLLEEQLEVMGDLTAILSRRLVLLESGE